MRSVHSATSLNSGAEEAAQAIILLINSQPRSPRPDEIIAVINKLVYTTAATMTCTHCASLDREYGPRFQHP
jgi:hypothetical protein